MKRSGRSGWGRVTVLAACGAFGWLGVSYLQLPDVRLLAHENPRTTALIEVRAEEAREQGHKPRRRQIWVALDAIARHAIDAVVLAEDASFYLHDGIDTVELRKAVEEALAKGSLGRGASTIPQQVAKNLWLSNERSLVRKAKEMILARRLDAALPKKRILTIYLNIAEWGDGVYGIEAAALEHFGIHAHQLSPAQGAMLAAMLPSPRKRVPRTHPKVLYQYAEKILGRMRVAGRLSPDQYFLARGELGAFFGRAPAPEPEPDTQASDPGVAADDDG